MHDGKRAPLRRPDTAADQRQMVNLRLYQTGDGAVALRATPDVSFRPKGQLEQLFHFRMVLHINIIGMRQTTRVKNPRFSAERLQQASGFFNEQT
ncbi:protein of unknown function (plasmid) [Paraburkholderia dioscoreae]|uniref:Uncharacterized protein n=1 Tax=Paraburkholderia dioscoreae TaxID=2604047 RepID=A0A5Q4YUT4_9BURK|nr:protein of unknown function [Paraburkholderia dioscoreae]